MQLDPTINWILINRVVRKILDVLYGLIGLFVATSMLVRQWQEGAFGNETHILFLYRVGPVTGFLTIGAGLSLTFGQGLILFNKKSGVWFARMSYFLAIIILVQEYLINGGSYIWNVEIDFLLFSLIVTIFYLPVILNRKSLTD